MKTLNIFGMLFFCLISSQVFSQISFGEKPMSLGNQPAYTLDIDFDDSKLVEKEWQSFLKEVKGKSKKDKKADEIVTEKVAMVGLGAVTTIHAKVHDVGPKTKLTTWVIGDGKFVDDSNESQQGIVEDLLQQFAFHMQRVEIQMELDGEEKTLKTQQKSLDRLMKDEKKNHENIAKYEQKILEAKADIERLVEEQKIKATEIEDQQKIIEEVTTRLQSVGTD